MPFVCTIDEVAAPASIEVIQHDETIFAIFLIGVDGESRCDYTMEAGFSPLAGGMAEFYFKVVQRYLDDETSYDIWDSKAVAQLICREDRAPILSALVRALDMILDVKCPERVQMVTWSPHVPDAALRKFTLLARVFKRRGYAVKCADPYDGHRTWWFVHGA